MPMPDWDERYASEDLPWDTGRPDPHLVELVERGVIAPGRALEVGCGTGTNSLYLAGEGFEVLGVDISPRAIARAKAKAAAESKARFAVHDFLAAPLDEPPFEFVLDRGVLHVFDDAAMRARFAAHVSRLLGTGGHWLSLVGSTEGPPRDHGPPRRTARELLEAIEPVLELVELRTSLFDTDSAAKSWVVLSRARELEAQPSTRRS